MKPEIERMLSKMEREACRLAWILIMAIGFVVMLSGLLVGQGEM